MKFLALSALAIVAVVNAQTPTPDAYILNCAEQACPSEFTSANTTDYFVSVAPALRTNRRLSDCKLYLRRSRNSTRT